MEDKDKKKIKYKNPFVDESAFEGDMDRKPSEDETLMEEAKQHTPFVEVKTYMLSGMIAGCVLGAVVGSIFDKMQFGMGIGMLIGLLVGTCIHKKPKQGEEK